MVLFIKPVTSVIDDMELVCKMMINIEQNKHIFNINGTLNNTNDKKPFNNFIHQQVNYEMTVSMGVLLVYIPKDIIRYVDIEQRLIYSFRENAEFIDYETKVPTNTCLYNSTCYTLLNTKFSNGILTRTTTFGTAYRRIINNIHDIRKSCESGSRFTWLIQIIEKPYLQIPELSLKIPNKIHLLRSISTIIYDGSQLFNVKHGLHQLDYPSLSQYNMFKNNQILDETVYISQVSGLDYEIAKYYNNNISEIISTHTSVNDELKTVDHTIFQLRRQNPEKKWYQQLSEPFNFDEQEDLEKTIEETGKPAFRNDVCFITGMPLYKNAYLLKVEYNLRPNNAYEEARVSYILVSTYIFNTSFLINNKYILFNRYLAQKHVSIVETYLTNFSRCEADVIDMIPEKNISPLKREIMKSISVNGIYKNNDVNYTYTADLQKNKIYIGIINNIHDYDIMKFNNTNTILFQTFLMD